MYTTTKKSWQEVKDKLNPHPEEMNGVAETKAMDAFLDERDKQTEFSKADREWEKDRKKEWADNKKYWKKEQEAKQQDPLVETIKDIKNGGSFQTDIHPVQGYILTKTFTPERRTKSGVLLPDDTSNSPNTAEVIEVGKGYYQFGTLIEPFVESGNKIIYRKMSGMDIEIRGFKYLMLHFDDVIAIID